MKRLTGVLSVVALGLAGCWMPSPSPGAVSYLSGVVAFSASNVWAVGSTGATSAPSDARPLVERFDGHSWQVAAAPSVSTTAWLSGIAGSSDTDVWAAGTQQTGAVTRAWVVRWNGSAWQNVPVPVRWSDSTAITGISEGADGSVAAVGGNATRHRPLVLLRTASGWVQLPDPVLHKGRCAPGQVSINGVSVASAKRVWISGNARGKARGNCPVVEEWNGTRWVDHSPPILYLETTVLGVLAIPSGKVLVSGYDSTDWSDVGFVAAWNGHRWTRQPTTASNTESEIDYLAVSGDDYWAEGWDNQAEVFHLVDGVWQEQPVQNDPEGDSYFSAIAVVDGHAFSVGSNSGKTLVDMR